MDFENFEKIFHHRNKLEPQKQNIPENNSPENLKKFLTLRNDDTKNIIEDTVANFNS